MIASITKTLTTSTGECNFVTGEGQNRGMKRLLLLLPLLLMVACQSNGARSNAIQKEGIIKIVCFEKEMAEIG